MQVIISGLEPCDTTHIHEPTSRFTGQSKLSVRQPPQILLATMPFYLLTHKAYGSGLKQCLNFIGLLLEQHILPSLLSYGRHQAQLPYKPLAASSMATTM
jgi:hypothetical protein